MIDFEATLRHAVASIDGMFATPAGLVALGSAAVSAALVIAGTFVKTMMFPSLPMAVLHAVLLPINLWRAVEMVQLTRRVKSAAEARDTSGLWLRPYMKQRKLAAGELLFKKGDEADHLYMLASGRIELVEIGVTLVPGRIFGEIAFFAPDRKRTMSARAAEPCVLLSIDGATVRQLYYQNPEFGFQLIGLVALRLSSDVRRLEIAAAQKEDAGTALRAINIHDTPADEPAKP